MLTFASDNGLYDHIEAYGNGDSGIYPGSGPEGHCERYGIEIRNVNSHDNMLGYSGTAGNGTWHRTTRSFHHNNAGISDDSFASGHPGMPQDCSKWDRQRRSTRTTRTTSRTTTTPTASTTPFEKRRKTIVCPQFQVPVGTGFILYGVNDNLIANNQIYDNWRSGVRLFWVPATIRGENDPAKQSDTSNGNRFIDNQFGVAPTASAQPNGIDFFWDEQGIGNCWAGQPRPRRHDHERPGAAAGLPGRARPAQRGNSGQDSPPRRRARRGIRETTRIRPAAPGSRPRPSRANEVVGGGDRPAPRRSGRAAAPR